jgi:predicted unusual protein kinase regulating ubiquinone biosynthesis (AarF/ABC1/UbiB family)
MRKRSVAAAVLGAIVTASAGYLAVQHARQNRTATSAPPMPVPRTTRAQRTASMARVGAKTGGSYAMHRARKVFASADRQRELDADFELKTAEQITEALGNMKGALMKLGQMASYLDAGLPEPVRAQLAQLQQNAPPMSAELAAQVIESELGAAPDTVFEQWDPVPLASASIGQVHRAITRDRTAVAVKVQYPGIGEAIRADLENADVVFQGIGMMFQGLETGPLVDELRERLLEELDYEQEAANQTLFADAYRDHPFIHVPDVVPALSTKRVLTTELGEGVRFAEVLTWSAEEKNLAAEAIYRFVFRSLYGLHAFNGDPHPGNYLFLPGGRVTFLDFGLVKHFTPAEVTGFEAMISAMVLRHDSHEFRKAVEGVGLIPAGAPFSDSEIEDYFSHFYEMLLNDDVVTITPEWSSATISRFFDPNGPYSDIAKAANLPPAFVIIQRINLGLMAVLAQLGATANFRRIAYELWPFVDGRPSTPMGEVEAAWLGSRT